MHSAHTTPIDDARALSGPPIQTKIRGRSSIDKNTQSKMHYCGISQNSTFTLVRTHKPKTKISID